VSASPSNHGPAEEELEELGDDIIIAQETLAHAPPPAANVQDEKRSIVISDKPPAEDATPVYKKPRGRSRGEATVVIRDRRKLDEMRREILESQRAYERLSSKPPRRPWLLWVGAALAAFVLGGVVAMLAGGTAPSSLETLPSAQPSSTSARQGVAEVPSAKAAPAPTVSLEDLPVERRRR
jgi:hypothetical protein